MPNPTADELSAPSPPAEEAPTTTSPPPPDACPSPPSAKQASTPYILSPHHPKPPSEVSPPPVQRRGRGLFKHGIGVINGFEDDGGSGSGSSSLSRYPCKDGSSDLLSEEGETGSSEGQGDVVRGGHGRNGCLVSWGWGGEAIQGRVCDGNAWLDLELEGAGGCEGEV
ncbi:hypothetical protein BU26DRAFT_562471 [Trematosphaeria pertusa]|uniref:Uncharacterized protein n=1 Tax=Trematosphaeria pertusa TaxID=390896 RepID=A0A6A6IJY1_9PLEO|nr:uncharacterized protein BU26DRAFT_562471 [Trematosphaeria pertusa]KAF2250487.1 hypothetical protein BU26DRAFT_562471 [Trematosphaeria pertusa]